MERVVSSSQGRFGSPLAVGQVVVAGAVDREFECREPRTS